MVSGQPVNDELATLTPPRQDVVCIRDVTATVARARLRFDRRRAARRWRRRRRRAAVSDGGDVGDGHGRAFIATLSELGGAAELR